MLGCDGNVYFCIECVIVVICILKCCGFFRVYVVVIVDVIVVLVVYVYRWFDYKVIYFKFFFDMGGCLVVIKFIKNIGIGW